MNEPRVRAVEEHYDRTAARWKDIYNSQTFHDHLIADRLRRALELLAVKEKGARAVDAGCGAGQMVAALAERGYRTSGFDISGNMVAASQELLTGRGLTAEVVQANGEELPYDDGSFDVVTALGYIEYFPSPAKAVAELARVAAPGAELLITAPNPLRLAYLTDPIGVVRGYLHPDQGYRRRYFNAKALHTLLEAQGLQVQHVFGHGLGPFSVAGRPFVSDARSIRLDRRLDALLPAAASRLLGANLIAVARK